jgi:hypothetical protein
MAVPEQSFGAVLMVGYASIGLLFHRFCEV